MSTEKLSLNILSSSILVLIFLFNTPLAGQQIPSSTVFGTITEQGSGERIVGAAIYVPGLSVGAYTDAQGYYSLRLGMTNSQVAIVSYPGYVADTVLLIPGRNDISLLVALADVVTVTAKQSLALPTGAKSYSIEELERIPALLGEPDLLKSLVFSAGIQEGAEGTSGINVRGGSDDQNLYLLDGSTVYNPNHVFGFLSLFHPATIKSLKLYKGYIPSRFSGRLSSVIDVGIKAGNNSKIGWKASLGPITNSLSVEGPIKKGKRENSKSFLVAGRLVNTALLTILSQAIGGVGDNKQSILAGMYDFTAKYTNQYKSGATLNLSFYLGDDIWGGRSLSLNDGVSGEEITWGNKITAVRYHRPVSPNVVYEAQINGNIYTNSYRNFERDAIIDKEVKNEGQVNELRSTQQLSWTGRSSVITPGLELSTQRSRPIRISFTDEVESRTIGNELFATSSVRSFLEVKQAITPSLRINGGVSVSYLRNSKANYQSSYIEPRIGGSFDVSERMGLGASYTRTAQPMHRISSLTAGLPYDIWLPATDNLPIETAEQYSAEFRYNDVRTTLVIAGYWKKMSNLIAAPTYGIIPTTGDNEFRGTVDRIIGGGQGEAYGGELSLSFQTGVGSSDISYTYSRSFRTFSDLNRGRQFAFDFDRPHTLNIGQQVFLPKNWEFNTRFVLTSGHPITLPEATRTDLFGFVSLDYSEINNARLGTYHRLDLSFTKRFVTKKRGRNAHLTLGVYNAYARANPVRVFLEELSPDDRIVLGQLQGYDVITRSVLQFIPSINYGLEW